MSEFGVPKPQVPVINIEKKERRELPGDLKVIIIEDQYFPQFNLLIAVKKHFGEHIKNFRQDGDVRIIDNFSDAEKASEQKDLKGVLVVLDNRMPSSPPDRSEQTPYRQGNSDRSFGEGSFKLYDEDLDFLADNAVDAGYTLAKAFQEAGAIVVGTSSFSESELRARGLSSPDFKIVKMDAEESLGEMTEKILDAIEEKMKEEW